MVSKSQVLGAYHGKLRSLAKLGIDLTVITPPRWGKDKLEIRNTAGYRLRVLPCLLSGYTHFHFYTAPIGPIEADLVHIEEEPWSLVTYQFMRRCVSSKKPVVFFTWQNINKKYPPPFAYFERYTFAHAGAAIAGNVDARKILEKRGFSKPITIIPQLGIDTGLFRKRDVFELRGKLAIANDSFIIGYVGRIVEAKGIADLVHAFALLPESCTLVLVGEGEFLISAKQLVQRLGVSSRVRWIPRVLSLEIPQYMNLFHALVLPSRTTPRWKEQFGHVLIEAMSSETPPVGSSSGEIPNVIGDAGLVFREGDVADLAASLRVLLEEPGYRASLGSKARNRVLKKFTDDRIAEETVRVYEQTLGSFSRQKDLRLGISEQRYY
jgi:glycosyltransferase involved in cell wall biosynthesis